MSLKDPRAMEHPNYVVTLSTDVQMRSLKNAARVENSWSQLSAMTNPKKIRKAKPRSPEKPVSVSFARKLLDDLETVDHAITMARLYATDKDDFRDGIEALVNVVDQQGKVLRELLLALEENLR
jgi:hypothetical protein